jgi:ATP-binding cassette subfamily C protein LapB
MQPDQTIHWPASFSNGPVPTEASIGEAPQAALSRIDARKDRSLLISKALGEIDHTCVPCVLLLSSAKGLAVTAILESGSFQAQVEDGTLTIHPVDLAPVYTGSIIVASTPQKIEDTASPKLATPDEPLDLRLSAIFRQMLKSGQILELILVAILSNIFLFALPLFSMAIYDRIIPHKAYETLWALAIGLVIILAMDFTGRILRTRIQEAISHRITSKAQRNLFSRILSTDLDHAPKSASGISGALSAIETACQLAPALLVGMLVDLPFIVLLFIYIGSVAKWLVLVPLISTAIIVVTSLVLHIAAKRAHAATARQNVEQAMLIEESIGSFAAAKVTTAQSAIFTTWSRARDVLSGSAASARGATHLSSQIANIVIQVNTILALVAGVFLIGKGDMTVGALVCAVMLSGRVLSPLINIVTGVVRLASLVEPLNLARALAQLPAEVAGDPDRVTNRIRGEIQLQSVELRYPEAPSLSLRGLDLTIRPGEKVAIIGRIGSGKSTLVKLMPRLHMPSSGSILIDGQDIRQYGPEFLRRQVAFMPQDCDLFDASIRENIVKGMDQVNELAFEDAVTISGVKDIIATHPSGYDLSVGRGGRRLSGGERQAVCLARTLVRNAPVIVLDEPTSAMDGQMEQMVVKQLKNCFVGKTVIIATHRTPLLSLVDRVIWLDNGRIIADGPPTEVIARASRAA